jgi:hypothetical protein
MHRPTADIRGRGALLPERTCLLPGRVRKHEGGWWWRRRRSRSKFSLAREKEKNGRPKQWLINRDSARRAPFPVVRYAETLPFLLHSFAALLMNQSCSPALLAILALGPFGFPPPPTHTHFFCLAAGPDPQTPGTWPARRARPLAAKLGVLCWQQPPFTPLICCPAASYVRTH